MNKPLAGKRIVITRARAQAGTLAQRVKALGGEAIEWPTIEIAPVHDFSALDDAVARIESYDWLIFTSVNGVEPFLLRLAHAGKRTADLEGLKVAAIGSETAKRLRSAAISVSLVPQRYQAEGILDALKGEPMRGKKVLLPRAAAARDVLPETLRRWGARVDVVAAYRTVPPPIDAAYARRRLQSGEIDVVTFTSSSTVRHFVQLFGGSNIASIVGAAAVACIGPITAQTVDELGGTVAIMAREFTIDGLVQAIIEHFGSAQQGSLGTSNVRKVKTNG